ncbi:MAG: NAD-dependent epimerase/dehydratase family protein [Planctomycetota bacterium]|jgi:UDP-glucose 4-epimerase|nr:NAD-dependent epimerase/dehydratase family protein [Planctomycetota bacterium]MDP6989374.1 NAD-dependent epimerase/dehydratase family protein [Planctomycetota bacterium]
MAIHLVTGGAGFIGSHLTAALVERGDRVRVLDDLSSGRRENLAGHDLGELGGGAAIELVLGDVADAAVCARACEGVSTVFHEAAQVSVPRSFEAPEQSYRTNVMGTLRLLEAARAAGVQTLILAGSSSAYGAVEVLPKQESMLCSPVSPYAAGKVAAEHLLRVWGDAYGLRTRVLRYFNVYGPRQADDSPYSGVIALFSRCLHEGRPPTIFGDGGQTRDFTFVSDVVAANLCAADADVEPGAIINVGTGERVTIKQLWDRMAALEGSSLEPVCEPERPGDVRHSVASIERAERWLGWRPQVEIAAGLERTLAWYRERRQQ